MAFNENVPQWDATGTEPPSSLKSSGFSAGYKPPAAYFNWFWNRVCACLNDLKKNALPKSGGTMTGTITVQNVEPDGDNTRDLGASGKRWANVFANNFFARNSSGGDVASVRNVTNGSASTVGDARVTVGNATAEGSAGNARGRVRVFSKKTGYVDLVAADATENYTQTMPAKSGTLAMLSDIPGAPDLSGYLPKTDGVAIGSVSVKKTVSDSRGAKVNTSSGTGASLIDSTNVADDTADRAGIKVMQDAESQDKLVQLFKVVSGGTTWYRLYGEHNKPTAADVKAGTFAGQVVANAAAQAPGTKQIRNSKLMAASTFDGVTNWASHITNGEIVWRYE